MKAQRRHITLTISVLIISAIFSTSAFAQRPTDSVPGDPSIHVYTLQNLKFGTFAAGASGGTVTVSPFGNRSATGSVILFNYQTFSNALFEIEAPPNIIVSFNNGPAVQLNGSNGGSILLTLDSSDPSSPFINQITPPLRTQIKLGGTLTVNGAPATAAGTYNGTFYITINQQ